MPPANHDTLLRLLAVEWESKYAIGDPSGERAKVMRTEARGLCLIRSPSARSLSLAELVLVISSPAQLTEKGRLAVYSIPFNLRNGIHITMAVQFKENAVKQ